MNVLPKSTVRDRRYGELTTVRVVVATRLLRLKRDRLCSQNRHYNKCWCENAAAAYLMTSVHTNSISIQCVIKSHGVYSCYSSAYGRRTSRCLHLSVPAVPRGGYANTLHGIWGRRSKYEVDSWWNWNSKLNPFPPDMTALYLRVCFYMLQACLDQATPCPVG